MPTFYIVATPIGNLRDISARALDVLKSVDLILCEDTRVTKKLLAHYQIKVPTLSYHQHSKLKRVKEIIAFLKQGRNLALVSDAGTPGISDPGAKLINAVLERCDNLTLVPIPGPSALTAAVSVCGFSMDRFLFLGFPPAKKKRKKFFEEVANSKYPVVFYESPHRMIKTLLALQSQGRFPESVVVCRELTKKFETIYRGVLKEIIPAIKKDKIKGEFVVIIKP